MSQTAVFDLTGDAAAAEVIYGPANQEYIGRLANFITDYMRGQNLPVGFLIDLAAKTIYTVEGTGDEVNSSINAFEAMLSGSSALNGEVFTPPADQVESASADWIMRNAVIDTNIMDDDSGIAATFLPSITRRSLSSMVEKIHSADVAKMIAFFQQSPADLSGNPTALDPNYVRGNLYAINNSEQSITNAFSANAANMFTYTDGDATSQAAPGNTVDTLGL